MCFPFCPCYIGCIQHYNATRSKSKNTPYALGTTGVSHATSTFLTNQQRLSDAIASTSARLFIACTKPGGMSNGGISDAQHAPNIQSSGCAWKTCVSEKTWKLITDKNVCTFFCAVNRKKKKKKGGIFNPTDKCSSATRASRKHSEVLQLNTSENENSTSRDFG